MDFKKLALLLVFAVVTSGIVAFQVRRARGITSSNSASAPAAQATAAPQSNAAPTQPVEDMGTVTAATGPVTRLPIPESGWGRNPFLTAEELAQLNQPVETPVEPEPEAPVVVEPPRYVVSAIITNKQGGWAVVDSRVVRVGDRLGIETIRAIESAAVVLEGDGQTRRLPLVSGIPEVVESPVP